MEPISTHARKAAANQRNRIHDQDELAAKVGLEHKKAYLITNETGDRTVGIVSKLTHENSDWFNEDTGRATRPRTVGLDEFNAGVRAHIEHYGIISFGSGCVFKESEPNTTHETPVSVLETLDMEPLEHVSDGDVFALSDVE